MNRPHKTRNEYAAESRAFSRAVTAIMNGDSQIPNDAEQPWYCIALV
jgi:hypothetical protein